MVVVSASGAIDSESAPRLYGAAAIAVQQKPEGFVFDFSDVDLLGSAGMQVLVTTMRMLGPEVGYAVVAGGRGSKRPLEIAGLDELVAVVTTLDEALRRVTGDQT